MKTPLNQSKTELLQMHVDGIIRAGGIPFLNYPNFADGLQMSDILPVKNLHHLELFNRHLGVANRGKEGHISVDAKWDSLLSRGLLIYGVPSDDMHNLETNTLKDANPFSGWIMVKSKNLSANALQKSIEKGHFYSTISVALKKCNMNLKK